MSFPCDTGRAGSTDQPKSVEGAGQAALLPHYVAFLCCLLACVCATNLPRPTPNAARLRADWAAICCGFSALAKFAQFLRFEICTNYIYVYIFIVLQYVDPARSSKLHLLLFVYVLYKYLCVCRCVFSEIAVGV